MKTNEKVSGSSSQILLSVLIGFGTMLLLTWLAGRINRVGNVRQEDVDSGSVALAEGSVNQFTILDLQLAIGFLPSLELVQMRH